MKSHISQRGKKEVAMWRMDINMENIKWKCVLIVLMLLALVLGACNSNTAKAELYSEAVEIDGQSLIITLDENNLSFGTITSENGTYTFEYGVSGNNIVFTVTYPDGRCFSQTEISGVFTTSAEYDSGERRNKDYIDIFALNLGIERVMDNARGTSNSGSPSIFLALALISIGVWNLFGARNVWWFSHGWWYKNAEPSDLALVLYRIAGVFLIFAGIICAIASF